jgi:hypothetical protein
MFHFRESIDPETPKMLLFRKANKTLDRKNIIADIAAVGVEDDE